VHHVLSWLDRDVVAVHVDRGLARAYRALDHSPGLLHSQDRHGCRISRPTVSVRNQEDTVSVVRTVPGTDDNLRRENHLPVCAGENSTSTVRRRWPGRQPCGHCRHRDSQRQADRYPPSNVVTNPVSCHGSAPACPRVP
jgi:hypothetical protein